MQTAWACGSNAAAKGAGLIRLVAKINKAKAVMIARANVRLNGWVWMFNIACLRINIALELRLVSHPAVTNSVTLV